LTGPDVDAVAVRRFERRAMGSPLRLTVVAVDARSRVNVGHPVASAADDAPDPIEAAWSTVSDEFEEAEDAMSRFRETSDLTKVNRLAGTGRSQSVDRRLVQALTAADRAGRLTGGRFDARVLGDLERLGYKGVRVERLHDGRLTDAAARPVRQAAPAGPPRERRWLLADCRASRVAVEIPIDLGGIGKGLALRWAVQRLERGGFIGSRVGILLEAGGDLVARPPAPEGGDWSIAIQDPAGSDDPRAVIGLRSGAVATSSVAIHRWRDATGRTVHHLIDPLTGEPGGAGLQAVTVAGPDPAWAEVWSKTLFLTGADRIGALARSRALAAWWVRDDGQLEMTPAARLRTLWSATDGD
jgi:FAD:protein FMN transferase